MAQSLAERGECETHGDFGVDDVGDTAEHNDEVEHVPRVAKVVLRRHHQHHHHQQQQQQQHPASQ